MMIENLVETMWLVRNPYLVEITFDREEEFLGHEFKNGFIEQAYGINKNLIPQEIHKKTQTYKEYIKY